MGTESEPPKNSLLNAYLGAATALPPPPGTNPYSPAALQAAALIDIGKVLDTLAKNPRDRVYKDQVIPLDGYTFTNCCFSNCELHTESGVFALNACLVMSDCRFIFGPAAIRIIKAFNLMFGVNPNAPWPVYNPAGNSNGSITIE